jgi:hypothetical protein
VVRQVGAVRGGVAGRISGNRGAVLAARGPIVVRFCVEMRSPKRDRFSVPFLGPFNGLDQKRRPAHGPENRTAYFGHRAASA